MQFSHRPQARIAAALRTIAVVVGAIWAVALVNLLLGPPFDRYGILPRTASGLVGIGVAPLVHANLAHLVSNTLPLLILGGMLGLRGPARFWSTTALIILIGGLGVWLLARSAYHIGASGLVFGYFGYLIALGLLERSVVSIAVACATAALYSGFIWGVLPAGGGVSWEAHLFGFAAGVLAAYLHRRG